MWSYRYLLSVALITACVVAAGVVLWGRDTVSLQAAPATGPGQYVLGNANAPVTIEIYPDFG